MGTQPTEIERDIDQQREQIGERIGNLRERLRSDAEEAQFVAQRQAARMSRWRIRDLATGAVGLGAGLGLWYMATRLGLARLGRPKKHKVVLVDE
jgi:hypothetical protein